MRIQTLGPALLAVFIPFFAYPTHAEPASAVRQVKVSYGDLALSSPMGAQALALRLRKAAQAVCEEPGKPLNRRMAARACEQAALSQAYRDIAARRAPGDLAAQTLEPAVYEGSSR